MPIGRNLSFMCTVYHARKVLRRKMQMRKENEKAKELAKQMAEDNRLLYFVKLSFFIGRASVLCSFAVFMA